MLVEVKFRHLIRVTVYCENSISFRNVVLKGKPPLHF